MGKKEREYVNNVEFKEDIPITPHVLLLKKTKLNKILMMIFEDKNRIHFILNLSQCLYSIFLL
jgi:hypothetical protein